MNSAEVGVLSARVPSKSQRFARYALVVGSLHEDARLGWHALWGSLQWAEIICKRQGQMVTFIDETEAAH